MFRGQTISRIPHRSEFQGDHDDRSMEDSAQKTIRELKLRAFFSRGAVLTFYLPDEPKHQACKKRESLLIHFLTSSQISSTALGPWTYVPNYT